MIGGNQNDNNLIGSNGNDVIIGFDGADKFIGGDGDDRYYGNNDDDQVDYSLASGGITIQLGEIQGNHSQHWSLLNQNWSIQRVLDGSGNWDIAVGIEQIIGSNYDDKLELHGTFIEIAGNDAIATDGGIFGGLHDQNGDTIDLSGLVTGSGVEVFFTDEGVVAIADRSNNSLPSIYVNEFENLVGTRKDDIINGNNAANILNGGAGADELYGGAGDDIILFDADDTFVFGEAGRDIGYVPSADAVTLDLTTSDIEVAIGGTGNDTLTMGNSADTLMAAGGAGDDLINVSYGFDQGPRIVWGRDGADVINLAFGPGTYTGQQDWRAGILVADVLGLTQENFADFSLDMLNVGSGFDWSQIDVVIINPDGTDQIQLYGDLIRTAEGVHELIGFTKITPDIPESDFQMQTAYTVSSVAYTGVEHTTDEGNELGNEIFSKEMGFLGNLQMIQSSTYYNPFKIHEVLRTTDEWVVLLDGDEKDLHLVPGIVSDAEFTWKTEIWDFEDSVAGGGRIRSTEYYDYYGRIDQSGPDPDSVSDLGSWFVVGGAFNGAALSSNGSISATMPSPGSISDWFLAA